MKINAKSFYNYQDIQKFQEEICPWCNGKKWQHTGKHGWQCDCGFAIHFLRKASNDTAVEIKMEDSSYILDCLTWDEYAFYYIPEYHSQQGECVYGGWLCASDHQSIRFKGEPSSLELQPFMRKAQKMLLLSS
jgi:hypothetical protein